MMLRFRQAGRLLPSRRYPPDRPRLTLPPRPSAVLTATLSATILLAAQALADTAGTDATSESDTAAVASPPETKTETDGGGSVLHLAALPDDDGLAALLWKRHPDFAELRGQLAESRADVDRARLRPNPELEAYWETIPVGPTNPEFTEELNRLTDIPTYGVALSQQFEIAKRGPRIRAAQHDREASLLEARESLRQHVLDVLEHVAEIAGEQARGAILERLVDDAVRLADLEKRRARGGEGTGLDAARAQVEAERLRAQLDETRSDLEVLLASCARLAAARCVPFPDETSARRFLIERANGWREHEFDGSRRADLLALDERVTAYTERERLARAHAIPDPEVRFGYENDTYIVAGNHQHGLSLGIALPLPLFDRGQADAREAAALAEAHRSRRNLLVQRLHHERPSLQAGADAAARRRDRLNSTTVPMARAVADALVEAVRRGGAPLQELLLARRAQSELELEAAEAELDAFRAALALARLAGSAPVLPDNDERR